MTKKNVCVARPSFDRLHMLDAYALSFRSTCDRAKVGCIVTTDDSTQRLSVGYNGSAKGISHGCISDEPGRCGCTHAEANCLIKLSYDHPSTKILYTTFEPCRACAALIINANISEVVYLNAYRVHDGLTLLHEADVKVSRYMPNKRWIKTKEKFEMHLRLALECLEPDLDVEIGAGDWEDS